MTGTSFSKLFTTTMHHTAKFFLANSFLPIWFAKISPAVIFLCTVFAGILPITGQYKDTVIVLDPYGVFLVPPLPLHIDDLEQGSPLMTMCRNCQGLLFLQFANIFRHDNYILAVPGMIKFLYTYSGLPSCRNVYQNYLWLV